MRVGVWTVNTTRLDRTYEVSLVVCQGSSNDPTTRLHLLLLLDHHIYKQPWASIERSGIMWKKNKKKQQQHIFNSCLTNTHTPRGKFHFNLKFSCWLCYQLEAKLSYNCSGDTRTLKQKLHITDGWSHSGIQPLSNLAWHENNILAYKVINYSVFNRHTPNHSLHSDKSFNDFVKSCRCNTVQVQPKHWICYFEVVLVSSTDCVRLSVCLALLEMFHSPEVAAVTLTRH